MPPGLPGGMAHLSGIPGVPPGVSGAPGAAGLASLAASSGLMPPTSAAGLLALSSLGAGAGMPPLPPNIKESDMKELEKLVSKQQKMTWRLCSVLCTVLNNHVCAAVLCTVRSPAHYDAQCAMQRRTALCNALYCDACVCCAVLVQSYCFVHCRVILCLSTSLPRQHELQWRRVNVGVL